jgi:hypothetical protein
MLELELVVEYYSFENPLKRYYTTYRIFYSCPTGRRQDPSLTSLRKSHFPINTPSIGAEFEENGVPPPGVAKIQTTLAFSSV